MELEGKKKLSLYISIDVDYDFISTKDLEILLAGLRKTLHKIRHYRSDPLSINHVDFEFGSGLIEIETKLNCSAYDDVVEFIRKNFSKPTKEKLGELLASRDNIKHIRADFEIQGESGEELGWLIR